MTDLQGVLDTIKSIEGEVSRLSQAIRQTVVDKENPFSERLKLAEETEKYLHDTDISGSEIGSKISLYDDLYWERHESMWISDVARMALDEVEEDELETSDHPRAQVLRYMLDNAIGRATYDW